MHRMLFPDPQFSKSTGGPIFCDLLRGDMTARGQPQATTGTAWSSRRYTQIDVSAELRGEHHCCKRIRIAGGST
jgi:hypothetical protein